MSPRSWFAAVSLVVLVVVAVAYTQRHAPVPRPFDKNVTIEAAFEASSESGRPVLAFATADWCGPCQSLKRGALSNSRVADLIAERTHPVYVDLTSDSPQSMELTRMLQVQSIPALILLHDGRELTRLTGGVSEARLIEWLGGSE